MIDLWVETLLGFGLNIFFVICLDKIYRSKYIPFPSIYSILIMIADQIGQLALLDFFGIDNIVWDHQIIAVEMYHLCICFGYILAILLPASLVPVLSLLGVEASFKIYKSIDIFAFAAFLGVLDLSIVFTIDKFSGNRIWVIDLRGSLGDALMLLLTFLLAIIFIFLGITFYSVVNPLRSSSGELGNRIPLESEMYLTELSDGRGEIDSADTIYNKDQDSIEEATTEEFHECQSCNVDTVERTADSEYGGSNSALCSTLIAAYSSQAFNSDEAEPVSMGLLETLSEVSSGGSRNLDISERVGTNSAEDAGMEANVHNDKNGEHGVVHKTYKNIRGKGEDTINANGEVKLTGISRNGRLQFAKALKVFWGLIFDGHGKLTNEAKSKNVYVAMALSSEEDSVSVSESAMDESQKHSSEAKRETLSSTISAKEVPLELDSNSAPKHHEVFFSELTSLNIDLDRPEQSITTTMEAKTPGLASEDASLSVSESAVDESSQKHSSIAKRGTLCSTISAKEVT